MLGKGVWLRKLRGEVDHSKTVICQDTEYGPNRQCHSFIGRPKKNVVLVHCNYDFEHPHYGHALIFSLAVANYINFDWPEIIKVFCML